MILRNQKAIKPSPILVDVSVNNPVPLSVNKHSGHCQIPFGVCCPVTASNLSAPIPRTNRYQRFAINNPHQITGAGSWSDCQTETFGRSHRGIIGVVSGTDFTPGTLRALD